MDGICILRMVPVVAWLYTQNFLNPIALSNSKMDDISKKYIKS
jgi:hypothetical protein